MGKKVNFKYRYNKFYLYVENIILKTILHIYICIYVYIKLYICIYKINSVTSGCVIRDDFFTMIFYDF